MKKSIVPIIIYAVVIIVLVVLISGGISNKNAESKIISASEFTEKMENGDFRYVYILDGKTAMGILNDSKKEDKNIQKDYDFTSSISSGDQLNEKLDKATAEGKLAKYDFGQSTTPWYLAALPYLSLLILVGLIVFFMFQQAQGNGKAMQFGRSTARLYNDKNHRVTFNDVAGADEEKEELTEMVDFLKNPQKYTEMGARIPKGVLLIGPPGTGKTLLAKAVAGEAGVPFFSITGSDFVELYVGVGASRVRDLFAQAKRSCPCIIFIDEIDAVGRRRGAGLGGGHDEREQTLNQLLVEMDGFRINEGIIVIAATNRADILDPALLRSGRFDRQVHVLMPDVKGREEIFNVHARNKHFDPDVSPREIAMLTSGFTGADIENLINESALLAVRRSRKTISMKEIKDSITKVLLGPEKRSHKVTDQQRRLVAYHEAGHAIVARVLPTSDPVSEVSIIPRGGAGGYTLTRPDDDNTIISRRHITEEIAMCLGGRAAEALVMGDISTGASSDIKRATELAKAYVTQYGMYDEIGPMYLGDGEEIFLGRDFSAHKTYSEDLAARIDAAIHKLVTDAAATASKILTEKRELLDSLAKTLLEREKISGIEFEAIYNGQDPDEALKLAAEEAEKAKAAEAEKVKAEEAEKAEASTQAEHDNEKAPSSENDPEIKE